MTEDTAVATPAIGDATGITEDTKTEDTKTGSASWDGVPEPIRNLLYNPPILPHESENAFFELFHSLESYANPENIIEYQQVYTATVSKWEVDRYRLMAVSATTNQQQAGLAWLFEQTDETAFGKFGEIGANRTARKKAMRCFTDSVYREEIYEDFESRGFDPDGKPFLLSLSSLATIERLLASSEKRYVATMKELEKRMAARKPA